MMHKKYYIYIVMTIYRNKQLIVNSELLKKKDTEIIKHNEKKKV